MSTVKNGASELSPERTAIESPLGAILKDLDENHNLARWMAAAKQTDAALPESATPVRFTLLRNITLEPAIGAQLVIEAARAGLRAELTIESFDNVQDVVFDSASALYQSAPDVVILALRLHTLAPRMMQQFTSLNEQEIRELSDALISRIELFLNAIRERSGALIIINSFEMPRSAAYGILDPLMSSGQTAAIESLNARLRAIVPTVSGAYIVDMDQLMRRIGYDRALDDRYWHLGRAPYRFPLTHSLALTYVKFARALKGKAKKCLVLDCDNTLWGGVIGEDGMAGIKLGPTNPGSAFVELHGAILDLYNRGVLIALNSKNNHDDAFEVFEKHPDSLLRPEHFVSTRINWHDKVSNLREIAAELNIGVESLVFVDDSPFECQYVREALPEVETIELPKDPSGYANIIRDIGSFDTLAFSDEDRRRSQMYRAESARVELRSSAASMEHYLRSLDLRITVGKANAFHVPRIAQLTQKTNQFNLTTRRYSESDIARMISDPLWAVYFAELEDKFDRAGLIAVVLVKYGQPTAEIDTFLMSCRVIGRGVEQALLAKVFEDVKAAGLSGLSGQYIPTAKNSLAARFYDDLGFTKRDENGDWWDLEASRSITLPEWFAEIRS